MNLIVVQLSLAAALIAHPPHPALPHRFVPSTTQGVQPGNVSLNSSPLPRGPGSPHPFGYRGFLALLQGYRVPTEFPPNTRDTGD